MIFGESCIETHCWISRTIKHDIHILDLVVDQLWIVGEKTCKVFDGDLDDYRQIMLGGVTKNKKKDFDSQSIKNSKNSKKLREASSGARPGTPTPRPQTGSPPREPQGRAGLGTQPTNARGVRR